MYVDLAGLAYYDPKLKEWISSQPVKTLPSTLYPWALSEKAGAVTCWPVGGTELKPVVDFLFTETPPASGDKSPTNPSTITGVTQAKVTRCGKNLINSFASTSYTKNGIAWTVNSDGTITADGTATDTSIFYLAGPSKLAAGLSYTLSGCPSGGSGSTYRTAISHGTYSYETGSGVTFVAGSSPATISCRVESGVTVSNIVFKPQLELGSAATSFEPYDGADYTIDLGGTYYGGEIDLATGLMTAKSRKVMINETCSFLYLSDYSSDTRVAIVVTSYSLPSSEFTIIRDKSTCDRLPLADDTANQTPDNFISCSEAQICRYRQFRIYMQRSTLGISSSTSKAETENAVKSFFTSNPATFIAYIAEELHWSTVQLSPLQLTALTQKDKYTPRLNTVYTDASAVQVGYVKSPIREEYELTQVIAAQGGNI